MAGQCFFPGWCGASSDRGSPPCHPCSHRVLLVNLPPCARRRVEKYMRVQGTLGVPSLWGLQLLLSCAYVPPFHGDSHGVQSAEGKGWVSCTPRVYHEAMHMADPPETGPREVHMWAGATGLDSAPSPFGFLMTEAASPASRCSRTLASRPPTLGRCPALVVWSLWPSSRCPLPSYGTLGSKDTRPGLQGAKWRCGGRVLGCLGLGKGGQQLESRQNYRETPEPSATKAAWEVFAFLEGGEWPI